MNTNLLKQLYDYVRWQQQEITRINDTLNQLANEMATLKKHPSVTVERLEYKFDQLKVETLEGTLNIGLNPSDLNGIEELSLPMNRKEKLRNTAEQKGQLLKRLEEFINKDVDSIVEDTKNQMGKHVDSQYNQLIKTDIQKQLPDRVDQYLHTFSSRAASDEITEEQILEEIYQTIIADITNGIHAFITQLPVHNENK